MDKGAGLGQRGRLWGLPAKKELVLFTRISGFYLRYFNSFSAVVRNYTVVSGAPTSFPKGDIL